MSVFEFSHWTVTIGLFFKSLSTLSLRFFILQMYNVLNNRKSINCLKLELELTLFLYSKVMLLDQIRTIFFCRFSSDVWYHHYKTSVISEQKTVKSPN